ncbi:hypothetical protein FOA43_001961 [Brettanomyces nanus]|uniref:Major facilitator superfamily (MFS) profile domain-containing protein n=1 Tax=Eeniella nana TaxID=13502 RepID=A0A875S4D0_EENNA|nr:uncharacterized protein FOA43_001961 [Brettanomyces nanus]QPG74629.1 hypothetical protein FOA43_001961 [Brettanomyces nanus]
MAKCVIGIGIGILVSTCPVYLSELMSPTLRGIGSMGINFSICFGQWIGSLIYFGCSKNYTGIDDSTGYKIAFGIQYFFGLGYLIPYLFNPDEVNMGARIMFVWTGTGVVLFVVMLFFLPETRGRTANEIEQLFVNKVGALKFKRAKFDEDDKLIMSSVGKEVSQA